MELNPEQLAHADRVLRQRAMMRISSAVTDPGAKAMVDQFASGRMSARDVMAHVENSVPAMRRFEQYVIRLARMTPQEHEAMRAEYLRQVSQIATELATPVAHPPRQRNPRPAQQDEYEDESLEYRTWLV
jgi:hypothetical protein